MLFLILGAFLLFFVFKECDGGGLQIKNDKHMPTIQNVTQPIVANDNMRNDSQSKTPKDSYGICNIEMVDLGLSIKWAGWNVGASSPEEYGGYYAWGETSEKDEYTDDTYIWWTTEGVKWYLSGKITKYCNNDSETHNDIGCYDGRGVLEAGDDVARAVMGGNWRMPTKKEITELTYNCKRKYTSVNGVPGFVLTGPNGNSIFLPLSGYKYEGELCYKNKVGCFWGSTVDSSCDRADHLYCSEGSFLGLYNMRYYGYNVRAVCE